MVGIVIVAHFHVAQEMARALTLIVGEQERVTHVDILPNEDVDKIKDRVAAALKSVSSGEGTIILTDMFGGTPSNISLSFLEEENVEVVTGVNLPMLIKLSTFKENKPLSELAHFITEYGRRNIYVATDVLKARKKEEK